MRVTNFLPRRYPVTMFVLWALFSFAQAATVGDINSAATVLYTQDRKPEVPWSIHVVRVPRHSALFEIQSTHGSARGAALATVSAQALSLTSRGTPVAAINGDFYQRQGSYSGNPRGLQIIDGEVTSAPVGTPSFWIDAAGEPHLDPTKSQLRLIAPDGKSNPLGLNDARRANAVVLYTAALGNSTRTRGGREAVLQRAGDSPWLPLAPGKVYRARVSEVRTAGNTALTAESLVLSFGPGLVYAFPWLTNGVEVQISTATTPDLSGAKTAISGGPILVHGGKAQRFRAGDTDTYEMGSATERHPRSAVGWNDEYFFLVEVDGRQRVSVGMTLGELATYMAKLGCTEAMNLDGGGSSTLWYNGQLRNRPCEGHERLVGNALVVLKKAGKTSPAGRDAARPLAPASP